MNILDYFGFRVKGNDTGEQLTSVIPPSSNDGSVVVDTSVVAGGWQGYLYDPEAVVKNDNELIRRYRELSTQNEIDSAITEIVNEAIVSDQKDKIVRLDMDDLKVSEGLKKKFNDSFEEILTLLDFNRSGPDLFRQWYVDGRLYYHMIFRDGDIKNGIAEVRKVDPFKIKKIKQIKKAKTNRGIEVVESIDEYYVFNDQGVTENNVNGIRLSADSVSMVTSGILDPTGRFTVGHLQKAVKPLNQLRMLEDAIMIYTLTRAPDRRIFYIDVGSLPKLKAEEYVTNIMNKFKNKLVYNAQTGEVSDSKKSMSMIEDFWMPRRDGGKGTEITTLTGSQSLINADFVDYFKDNLYNCLNVPKGRFNAETGFSLGRTQEISRDEIKFNKFVNQLRLKFSKLFSDMLRIQLIAKGLIKASEWEDIEAKIRYDFIRDNHFAEMKDAEILQTRLANLQAIDAFVGKYYSKAWVQKNVLRLSEEETDQMNKEIEAEGPSPEELAAQQAQMGGAPMDPSADGEQPQQSPVPPEDDEQQQSPYPFAR